MTSPSTENIIPKGQTLESSAISLKDDDEEASSSIEEKKNLEGEPSSYSGKMHATVQEDNCRTLHRDEDKPLKEEDVDREVSQSPRERPAMTNAASAAGPAHHQHHRSGTSSSMRMTDVATLMREQDADLLESIHIHGGPNETGMTPQVMPYSSSHGDLKKLPELSLPTAVEEEHSITGLNDTSDNQKSLLSTPVKSKRFFVTRQSSKEFASSANSATAAAAATASTSSPWQGQQSVVAVHEDEQLVPMKDHSERTNASRRLLSHQESFSSERRALSGEVFGEDAVDYASTAGGDTEGDHLIDGDAILDEEERSLKRTESNERRMNEAAQFAEAVGDVPITEQEKLRIIDDAPGDEGNEDDDDDDDDDATEIHIERKGVASLMRPPPKQQPSASSLVSATTTAVTDKKTSSDVSGVPPSYSALSLQSSLPNNSTAALSCASAGPETPIKTRPQWPSEAFSQHLMAAVADQNYFSSDAGSATTPRRKAGFLAQLPSSMASSSQDFVYKGIRANPPEIVKRGTTRGNYAQLHRKAWLEVSDKYHRYGKHLRLYYRYWERVGCPTNMFFDWLDSKGEAAGQPLPELPECPRSQLDSDTVLYITNPDVTEGYALGFSIVEIPQKETRSDDIENSGDADYEVIRHGRVVDVDGDPVKTGPDGWIFVLRDNVMYGAMKITSVSGHSKQRFHHSSFFGGKAVAAAGIFITDDNGFLKRLYPHSGHYRPGEAHMQRVLFFLYHVGIDLNSFEVDTQQIFHVTREKEVTKHKNKNDENNQHAGETNEAVAKPEKKKKTESLSLMPAVVVAGYLAHKARYIGEGIFAQIHQIRKAEVASVTEALDVIDDGGHWPQPIETVLADADRNLACYGNGAK